MNTDLKEHYDYAEQMRRDYYSGALDKHVKPEELEKQREEERRKRNWRLLRRKCVSEEQT